VTRPEDAAVSEDAVPNDAVPSDPVPSGAVPNDAGPSNAGPSNSAPGGIASTALASGAPGSSPVERISRTALLSIAAAAGVAVGAIGSFGHRTTNSLFGVSWPVGLLFCLCGLVGLLLGLTELLTAGAPDSWRPTRLSALGCASAGWLLALLWITYLGPPPSLARKGDVVLANDARSLLYLVGGMFLITVAVYRAWVATLSARLARRPGAPGSGHPKG
jgi:hypothetical protein